MLFIHQQIQSFLNLGACKEFPNMAKPRVPRKGKEADVKQASTFTNTPPRVADVKPEFAQPVVAAVSAPDTAKTEVKKPEVRPTTRKPEIVKSEGRATLLPINLDEEVRRLAYLFSERRGFEAGHETEDWLTAEREVRQRYNQQSAHQQSA
jgi:Protein of unknown function (DUF2934)